MNNYEVFYLHPILTSINRITVIVDSTVIHHTSSSNGILSTPSPQVLPAGQLQSILVPSASPAGIKGTPHDDHLLYDAYEET